MALFKRILGNDKRTKHRWVSGHLELGLRKERERQIAEQIAKFKEQMDRQGVAFRSDRDAWEAYWSKNNRAHMELVGASVDEVLYEKAFQVFCGFWQRVNKPSIVSIEGDGEFLMPALLTLGRDDDRVRANPLDLLKSTDPEERAISVTRIDQNIRSYEKTIEKSERMIRKLSQIRDGLQTGATATTDPDTGVVVIQGLLVAPDEEADDDDTTA